LRARLVLLTALLTLLPLASAVAQESEIERRFSEQRAHLRAAMHAEQSLLRQIYAIEDVQYKHERALAGVRSRFDAVSRRLEDDKNTVARLEMALPAQSKVVGKRMAVFYRLGRGGFWKLLLTSHSFGEFTRRYRALRRIVELDVRLVAMHRTELTALRDRRKSLLLEQAQLARLAEAERAAAMDVELEKRKKMFVLEEIQHDKQLAMRLMREMDQQDAALSRQIAGLAPQSPRRSGAPLRLDFAQRRGYLPRPVPGPIVGRYGPRVDSRFGTETRSNGIDIQAPAGTPVRVVADGVVRYVGEFVGYGRLVIVEHGDRYHTLYAHLAEIAVNRGDAVHEGEVLGALGSSGLYEQPMLHFEIRRQGAAVDPLEWLALAP
jgi:septal ring factor EnvC (AmiA/AmiB activator)